MQAKRYLEDVHPNMRYDPLNTNLHGLQNQANYIQWDCCFLQGELLLSYLLNFNYTYTYEAVYGERALIEHHPIHGEAKEENLVLGIPDETFPNTLDYIYFQKY